MTTNTINIKNLTLEELVGIINFYPWYGGARKELCERMAGIGGDSWGTAQFSDAALYVVSRNIISDIANRGRNVDCSDKDIDELLKTYIASEADTSVVPPKIPEPQKSAPAGKQARTAFGDFFSQAEYEQVKRAEDKIFGRTGEVRPGGEDRARRTELRSDISPDFCTETLAEIYLEQGYLEEAKRIYSKLLLNFPEKSSYFAGLIDKINIEINK